MDPKLMAGVVVLALMQLFAAVQVMRAASERPDLTGLARFIPVLLALFVPVLGPLIGARATDAGMRPMIFSVVGTVVCLVAVMMGTTPPQGGPRPVPVATNAPGQPPADAGQTPPAEAGANQPAPETNPADTPAPAPKPQAKPAPKPEAKPAPEPEAKPAPEPEAKPAPKPEAKPEARPAAAPQATPTTPEAAPVTPEATTTPTASTFGPAVVTGQGPVAVPQPELASLAPGETPPAVKPVPLAELQARAVQTTGQIVITPSRSTGTLVDHPQRSWYNNTRIEFAGGYLSPPGISGEPRFTLGGRVWLFNNKVDFFWPVTLADGDIVDGRSLQIPSAFGQYLAEVHFSGVEPAPDGHILKATVDVRIR